MHDLIVVSSFFREDVSWLEKSGFPHIVVSKGQSSGVHNEVIVPNKGLEFGSYLWYLLHNWDRLPEKIAFIHGHRHSYHQSLPIDESIKLFYHSNFASLNGDFSTALHRLDQDHPWFGRNFPEMWAFMGLGRFAPPPSLVSIPPSTQTVVARGLLRSFGRDFWERIFNSLMEHEAHLTFALVLEIAWPMLFGIKSDDGTHCVQEFSDFFDDNRLSVLIANPGMTWSSAMTQTVSFDPPLERNEWIRRCLWTFENYSKVC